MALLGHSCTLTRSNSPGLAPSNTLGRRIDASWLSPSNRRRHPLVTGANRLSAHSAAVANVVGNVLKTHYAVSKVSVKIVASPLPSSVVDWSAPSWPAG